jgi:hypothetical protein
VGAGWMVFPVRGSFVMGVGSLLASMRSMIEFGCVLKFCIRLVSLMFDWLGVELVCRQGKV